MINEYVQNLASNSESLYKAVLGDENNVSRLGGFYLDNSELFLMATLHCLLQFYKTENFDAKEAMAYRKAIEDLSEFFLGCSEEHKKKLAKSIDYN